MPRRMRELVEESAVIVLGSTESLGFWHLHKVLASAVERSIAAMAEQWWVWHFGVNRFAGGNWIEDCALVGGGFGIRNPVALVDIEDRVVAQEDPSVPAEIRILIALFGCCIVEDAPEYDRRASFATAHVATQVQRLFEGKPIRGAEALGDKQEYVDSSIGSSADQIQRKSRDPCAFPRPFPRDDSLTKQGEDAIGDDVIDLLTHGLTSFSPDS